MVRSALESRTNRKKQPRKNERGKTRKKIFSRPLAGARSSHRETPRNQNNWTQMNTDSLKMLWRVSECPKQALLARPSLTPHTLPTLARCQLRSAQPLSKHTERANSLQTGPTRLRRRLRRGRQDVRLKGQGGHRVSKQIGLFSHSLTPMPAAASHRLPPSEALSELDIHSKFPCSLRGEVFERMSKINRLEGGRNLRSRFPSIGDHNA